MPLTWKYERAGILLLACPIDETNFPWILNPRGARGGGEGGGATIYTTRTRSRTWTLTSGYASRGSELRLATWRPPSSCTPGFSTKRISLNTDPAGLVPTRPFYSTHTVPSLSIAWLSRDVPLLGVPVTGLLCPFIPWGSRKRIFPEYQKTFLHLVAS